MTLNFGDDFCQTKLVDIGLDLTYYLEAELQSSVERWLRDGREKLIESVKLRALEDKWRPINLVNKAGVQRFTDDMNEVGIASVQPWIYGKFYICCLCQWSVVYFVLDDRRMLGEPYEQHDQLFQGVSDILGGRTQAVHSR